MITKSADNVLDLIIKNYGPYAFGLISLLIMWYVIVAPELARNRVQFDQLQSLAETMRDTAEIIKDAAREIRDAQGK